MWNKLFKNEQGFTLVITILAIMLISILGLSLMTTTANSKKISQSEYVDQSAYYIAEAGLTLAINTIDPKIKKAKEKAEIEFSKPNNKKKELEDLYTTQLESLLFNDLNSIEGYINNYNNDNNFDSSNATININITKIPDKPSLTIISTGTIDGQKRTVKQSINILPLTGQNSDPPLTETEINSIPPSNETEIESAIRDLDAISKNKTKNKYLIDHKDKKITFEEVVTLNASTDVDILTGDHFKGWTFVFKGGLDVSGNGRFITSAKIEVQGNLKITGAFACLLTYVIPENGSMDSLKVPEGHHPEKSENAVYIQPKKGCGKYNIGNDTSPLYKKSQPIEINNPI